MQINIPRQIFENLSGYIIAFCGSNLQYGIDPVLDFSNENVTLFRTFFFYVTDFFVLAQLHLFFF